nr:MAG TPA: Frog antimicrobial peptide [Caudoviricetes sp.]
MREDVIAKIRKRLTEGNEEGRCQLSGLCRDR